MIRLEFGFLLVITVFSSVANAEPHHFGEDGDRTVAVMQCSYDLALKAPDQAIIYRLLTCF
jgi:hypothetical protein